jgi:pyruvate dehydrogenase E1 component alpha subunit
MDVHAVAAAGRKAVERARAGEGPYILEMMTYRYRGHSMSDPAKYRSREEVQKMRDERDPIEQVRRRLIEQKRATEDELKGIDQKIRGLINEASEFATNSAEPDPSELWTDILR